MIDPMDVSHDLALHLRTAKVKVEVVSSFSTVERRYFNVDGGEILKAVCILRLKMLIYSKL